MKDKNYSKLTELMYNKRMNKELNYRDLAKSFLKGEFDECFVVDSEENITKIASYYETMCSGKGEEAVKEATEYLQDNTMFKVGFIDGKHRAEVVGVSSAGIFHETIRETIDENL